MPGRLPKEKLFPQLVGGGLVHKDQLHCLVPSRVLSLLAGCPHHTPLDRLAPPSRRLPKVLVSHPIQCLAIKRFAFQKSAGTIIALFLAVDTGLMSTTMFAFVDTGTLTDTTAAG